MAVKGLRQVLGKTSATIRDMERSGCRNLERDVQRSHVMQYMSSFPVAMRLFFVVCLNPCYDWIVYMLYASFIIIMRTMIYLKACKMETILFEFPFMALLTKWSAAPWTFI